MDVDEDDVIIEISPTEYTALIHITKSTQKVLASGKDLLKKRIQDDTQTVIKWSKIQTNGKLKRIIEIKGTSHQDVCSARQEIEAIGGKDSSQPTHFTCIKITDSMIKENYLKFKDEVLNNHKITETHKGAFMKPEKLHITFGVMCLSNDESQLRAKQILADCLESIVKPIKMENEKIDFKVNGLDLMKGSPSNARVLYAKIQSDTLQTIADRIAKSYIDAGLGKKELHQDAVKLHMTLMNIKYAKPRKNKAKSFDATHIFEHHTEFDFGYQEVSQILLVDMKKKDADGFYKYVASIDW